MAVSSQPIPIAKFSVMRDFKNAKQIAQSTISELGEPEIVILDNSTREFEAGWVFYYQFQQFIGTNELGKLLFGNAPIFVPRLDLPPTYISYHRPIEESMTAFKRCGDANGGKVPAVSISTWEVGASRVGAINAIRSHSTLGLADAKLAVDKCLNGGESTVTTKSIDDADELVRKLAEFGFHGYGMYRAKTDFLE